jgi:hypothetical protein
MIIYTLLITTTSITAHDGMLPRSRLRYVADNFRVYVSGHLPVSRISSVAHMATELCIAHHIPAITLKRHVKD